MNKYELTFIVRPDIEEKEIENDNNNEKKVIEETKSKITEEKQLGQKELAYEIKKFNVGYYFYYEIEATKEAITELDRQTRLNEKILRHLIVKQEDSNIKAKRRKDNKPFTKQPRMQRPKRQFTEKSNTKKEENSKEINENEKNGEK